jgi:hypothetical protein
MEKLNLLAISLPNGNEWHLIAKKWNTLKLLKFSRIIISSQF